MPVTVSTTSMWVIHTDHDETDGATTQTVVVSINCAAEEMQGVTGPLTVIQADHVQIVIPGELWEIERITDKHLIG